MPALRLVRRSFSEGGSALAKHGPPCLLRGESFPICPQIPPEADKSAEDPFLKIWMLFRLADDMHAGRRLDIQGLMPSNISANGGAGIRVRVFLQTGRRLVQDDSQAR